MVWRCVNIFFTVKMAKTDSKRTLTSYSWCENCHSKCDYLNFESTFGSGLLKKDYTDSIIKDYKDCRRLQLRKFKLRSGDCEGELDIAKQVVALKAIAFLINNYEVHPCKAVFHGAYFACIDANDAYGEDCEGDFDTLRFGDCLQGEEGDEEQLHTEYPGPAIYVCSKFPFHGPTRLPFLLHIVNGLRERFGHVDVEYNYFDPVPTSVSGHSIFLNWQVNKAYPSLYLRDLDFRICLKPVYCSTFRFCESWIDFADVFLMHETTGFVKCVSPEMDIVYDRSVFPLTEKCKSGTDLAYRLMWRKLCGTKNQTAVTRILFMFLENDRCPETVVSTSYKGESVVQPLIEWIEIARESCSGDYHDVVSDKSDKRFTNVKLCQTDAIQETDECGLDACVDTRLECKMCDYLYAYLEHNFDTGDNGKSANSEYRWVLYESGRLCPHPEETGLQINHHKVEVACGGGWHGCIGDCFDDFHCAMRQKKQSNLRRHYELGELAILVRPVFDDD